MLSMGLNLLTLVSRQAFRHKSVSEYSPSNWPRLRIASKADLSEPSSSSMTSEMRHPRILPSFTQEKPLSSLCTVPRNRRRTQAKARSSSCLMSGSIGRVIESDHPAPCGFFGSPPSQGVALDSIYSPIFLEKSNIKKVSLGLVRGLRSNDLIKLSDADLQ